MKVRKNGHVVEFWPEEDHQRDVLIYHAPCECGGFEEKDECDPFVGDVIIEEIGSHPEQGDE